MTLADGSAVASVVTKNYGKQVDSSDRDGGPPNLVMAGPASSDASAYDPQPDGRRYAACGDGVVANVAEWIGRRIIAYEQEAVTDVA